MARQRVDNMGAGWLKTGARAVISEPYSNEAGWYIAGLFTTHQSINGLWQAADNSNHNVQSWTSARNSWAKVQLDTNPHASATDNHRYNRAISGDMTLATDAVVGIPISSPYGQSTLAQPGSPSRGVDGTIELRHGMSQLR